MNKRFSESDFPYAVLEKFGLSQTMIEDLPVDVLQTLYDGGRSPLLPLSMVDNDGMTARTYASIAIISKEDGGTDVVFYPTLQANCLEREHDGDGNSDVLKDLTEDYKARLREGRVIIAPMTTSNGVKTSGFHQIDPKTKQLLSVPTPVIGRNLQIVASELHLSSAEINCLQGGEPLTVVADDEMITMGVSLEAPTGMHLCVGDERKWREDNKREYGRHDFGAFGCWTMNEDGTMDYIPESEYSQELWEEMKRKSGIIHR